MSHHKLQNLDFETKDYEINKEGIYIEDHIDILEKSNVDQIDLESEINRLDIKKNDAEIHEIDPNIDINNEEIKEV